VTTTLTQGEPTNNRAELALCFAVFWRKRSNGTQSDKGNRWVERLLSFRQTCRLRAQAAFLLLVDILKAHFTEQSSDLNWLTGSLLYQPRECLPVITNRL